MPAPITRYSTEPGARSRRRRPIGIVAAISVVLGLVLIAPPAWAAAPNTPVLVAPANGSTSTLAAPLLRVNATDPDGDDVQVTFEGRRAGATVPGSASEPFSIVVLPDTQNYTYLSRQGTILQQAQWAVSTRTQLRTAFVAQLGDLVSEYDNLTQWGHVSTGLAPLDAAGMPNSVVPGNHDFDIASGSIEPYNTYFPPSRYAGASWTPSTASYGGYLGQSQFGADPVDRRNFDNYSLFTAGGQDFLMLNLEWEAPQYALDWAHRVITAHPDRTVVMTTHSFVSINGNRRTVAERPGGTAPAAMWTNFVATHCSIRLVLSGHEHNGDAGEARRTDLNNCGQPVHQILTDYQDRANGGDGWLRYYTFDPAAGAMTAHTYSPKLGVFETDVDSTFTVPFPLGTQVPAPFSTIATSTVASGVDAQTAWSGLDPDTAYEWRVRVSDGTSTTTSATWSVRTPTAAGIADDTFTRTAATGWGRTDTGHDWTLSSSATSYSVDGSRGRVAVPPGSGRAARLATVSLGPVAIAADVSVTPAATGSGSYVSLLSRLNGGNSYRAKLQFATGGVVNLFVTRFAGTETTLGWLRVPGTFTAGQSLHVAFESIGSAPTTLRAKVWPTGGTEPAGWLVSVTDATAGFQGAGAVGIDLYQSGSATATATVSVDRFTAGPLGAPPPPPPPPANVAPVAVIATPTITGRTVSVSATGSTDSDGMITGYSWNFGDGTTATGPTASRTYATDGTYPITLTVTDDDLATGSVIRSVSVSNPPPPPPPPGGELVRDDFGRNVTGGWGAADAGGSWTFGGSSTRYAVGGGVGQHVLTSPGTNADTMIAPVTSNSAELRASLAFSRTAAGGTMYATLIPRAVTPNTDYRVRIAVPSNGRPVLILLRTVGGAETQLATTTLSNITVTAGTWYSVAIRAVPSGGSTSVSAKLWPRGTTEPATWQVAANDSTAPLQAAGWSRLNSYQSGSATAPITTSWDDVRFVTITP